MSFCLVPGSPVNPPVAVDPGAPTEPPVSVIDPGLDVVDLTVALTFESDDRLPVLIGFEAYSSPEIPPQKYRYERITGTLDLKEYWIGPPAPIVSNFVGAGTVYGHPADKVVRLSLNLSDPSFGMDPGEVIVVPGAGPGGTTFKSPAASFFSNTALAVVQAVNDGINKVTIETSIPHGIPPATNPVIMAGWSAGQNGMFTCYPDDDYHFHYFASPLGATVQTGGTATLHSSAVQYFVETVDAMSVGVSAIQGYTCMEKYPPGGSQTGVAFVFNGGSNDTWQCTMQIALDTIDTDGTCHYRFVSGTMVPLVTVPGGGPVYTGRERFFYVNDDIHTPASPGTTWTKAAGTGFGCGVVMRQSVIDTLVPVLGFSYQAGIRSHADTWDMEWFWELDDSITQTKDKNENQTAWWWLENVNPLYSYHVNGGTLQDNKDIEGFYFPWVTLLVQMQPTYVATVNGPIAKTTTGLGCVQGTSGFGFAAMSANGDVIRGLYVPDTEAEAIIRATSTPGTSNVARYYQRGAGEFSFPYRTVDFTIHCTDLTPGTEYTATVTLTTEDYGGGNAVITTQDYVFTAVSTTHLIIDTVVAVAGKQITVSPTATLVVNS